MQTIISVLTAVVIIYMIFSAAMALMAYAWKTFREAMWFEKEKRNEEGLASILSGASNSRSNTGNSSAASGRWNGQGRAGTNGSYHYP
jgi:uncharacterized membrane protein YgcG